MILTDSAINLHRLRKNESAKAKLGRFEQRRLKIIEDIVNDLTNKGLQISIRHVRGECNPADRGTRAPQPGECLSPLHHSTITEGLLTSPPAFCFPVPPQDTPQGSSPLSSSTCGEGFTFVGLNSTGSDDTDDEVTIDELLQDQLFNPKIDEFRASPYYEVLPNGLVARIVGIDVDSVDDVKTTPRHQVVIHNDELKKKLIAKAHAVGHRGRVGTLKLLKQRYFWHGIARDCRRYVDACERCQFARADRVQRQSMGSIPWPGAIGCLRVCAVDMTGPYRVCSGASGSTSANPSSEDPD
ncbi:hypothetical protein Pmar_PMAR023944, partial [Perkinsus marinus ATCC 50983]